MDFLIHRLWIMSQDAAIAAIVLVPLFLFLQKKYWHDAGQTVLYLLFALYLSGVYAAAGLPRFHNLAFRPRWNFTPFEYMFSDYRSSLLNVLFFVPLGFLLPLIWNRFKSFLRTLLFALGLSIFIEAVQLFTPRATDVNDLITNTTGAVLGWCLARILQFFFTALKPDNETKDVYWICGAVGVTMFLVYPVLLYTVF